MNEKKDDKKKKQKQLYTMIILCAILGIGAIVALLVGINHKNNDEEKNMAYTDLIKEIDNETVEKLEMTVGSTSVSVKFKNEEKEKSAIVPSTQAFIELIQEKVREGNEIELIQKPKNVFLQIPVALFSLLPTL